MPPLIVIPLLIISLVILSHLMGLKWKITDDRVFSPFHFATGGLVAAWWFLLLNNALAALLLTMSVGAIWELYEWYAWKLVWKKAIYKPKPWDTRNDMILDVVGGLVGVGAAALLL